MKKVLFALVTSATMALGLAHAEDFAFGVGYASPDAVTVSFTAQNFLAFDDLKVDGRILFDVGNQTGGQADLLANFDLDPFMAYVGISSGGYGGRWTLGLPVGTNIQLSSLIDFEAFDPSMCTPK